MIVFIDIKDQIIKHENTFMFYDMVNFEIFSFYGWQVFEHDEDFINFYKKCKKDKPPLEDFLKLIPDRYLRKNIVY